MSKIVEIENGSNHDISLNGNNIIVIRKGEKRKFIKPLEVTNINELRESNVRIKEVLNEG